MHRAVSMRLGPLPCPTRALLRRPAGKNSVGYASAPALLSTRCALQQPQQPLLPPSAAVRAKGICSTAPAWKGRRGGASALMPKKSGRIRRKVPGAGKKKKPKVCCFGVGMQLDSKYQALVCEGLTESAPRPQTDTGVACVSLSPLVCCGASTYGNGLATSSCTCSWLR